MGLDNIPCEYPCITSKSAVIKTVTLEGGAEAKIDCAATRTAGGCPWHKRLGDQPGAVTGILGAPCWYRGKYGVALLTGLGLPADELWGDETGLMTPTAALQLADAITDRFAPLDAERDSTIMCNGRNVAADVWYLHDWLAWVAAECGGAIAWY